MKEESLTIDAVTRIVSGSDDESIQIVRRDKNEEFMYENNITESDAKNFVRSLTRQDLVDGPVEDYDPNRKHPLWIFKKFGFMHQCYIKLKIINKNRIVIVVSLHEDEQ